MKDNDYGDIILDIDLTGDPVSHSDIDQMRQYLMSTYWRYINYITGLLVLSAGLSYRAFILSYDTDLRVFGTSITIGFCFGLFTGFIVSASGFCKLKTIGISVITSMSASLLLTMFATLIIGAVEPWIVAVSVLGSAYSSMWVLVYYGGVINGIESAHYTNQRQTHYIRKAASHFEELDSYNQKITDTGRTPLVAEYWAIKDWLQEKKQLGVH